MRNANQEAESLSNLTDNDAVDCHRSPVDPLDYGAHVVSRPGLWLQESTLMSVTAGAMRVGGTAVRMSAPAAVAA